MTGYVEVTSDQGPARVVREEPLLIELASEEREAERVLTMRTPGHDEELAIGFLLGEGILPSYEAVASVELASRGEAAAVDVVTVRLAPGHEPGPVERERLSRAHAIRPSCGLCGLTSAEGLTRHLRTLTPHAPAVDLARLGACAETMRAGQTVFRETGGCHAAAVFGPAGGAAWAIREDVGRHNALDKALGRCVLDGRDLREAVVILSGRGGYELILKALRLAVPVVASVSAPSSLAVELADEHGLTLIGFLRDGAGRVYTDDGRVR